MLEAFFWCAGAAMLGAFFMIRGVQDSASEDGIEAFEQARAAAAVESLANSVIGEARAGEMPAVSVAREDEDESSASGETQLQSRSAQAGPNAISAVPQPDFSDWSEKRISEYQESLVDASERPLAVLSIDSLNIKVPVYDGASDLNLNRGVARIKGTARIDEWDNLGIAGHRDGFFRGLQHIKPGDQIDLDTLTGQVRYRVTEITIVNPEDVYVLDPTDSRTLTLVTCYPFYFAGSAPQRYIVTAEAVTHQVRS